MIDCPECNGAGSIATSYREVQPKKPIVKVKKKSLIMARTKAWCKEYWGMFPVIAVIGALATLMFRGISGDIERASLKRIEDAKHGYFIVQYDEANAVQRCWITPSKEEISLVGKGAYAWVYDMDNPGDIPASIGISIPSKCVRIK